MWNFFRIYKHLSAYVPLLFSEIFTSITIKIAKIYLVTFAVIFQTATPLTIATFVMPPNVFSHITTFSNLRTKCVGISFQTRFNSTLSFFLVSEVIRTVVAVTHVTKLSIRKAIAVSACIHFKKLGIRINYNFSFFKNVFNITLTG